MSPAAAARWRLRPSRLAAIASGLIAGAVAVNWALIAMTASSAVPPPGPGTVQMPQPPGLVAGVDERPQPAATPDRTPARPPGTAAPPTVAAPPTAPAGSAAPETPARELVTVGPEVDQATREEQPPKKPKPVKDKGKDKGKGEKGSG